MKCKVLVRVESDHIYFQYLIETVPLISWNNIDDSLEIDDWVKNVERLQKNEGDD